MKIMRKPIIVGNWKMNTTVSEAVNLVRELKSLIADVLGAEVAVAPPFTALFAVSQEIEGSNIQLCGQDVFWEKDGAFTGAISTSMLKDLGCRFVIVGHSERRQHFGETDEWVSKKIRAALEREIQPIVCVGESLEHRDSGKAFSVVETQVRGCFGRLSPEDMETIVVAYEPIWAIGTGKTATPEQAEEMHQKIRSILEEVFGRDTARNLRIQYGGSVKADNMSALMKQPDIDGALVGGASLKADSFARIVKFNQKG